jgi:hypothetical protein
MVLGAIGFFVAVEIGFARSQAPRHFEPTMATVAVAQTILAIFIGTSEPE